jgi:hypothetical protein
MIDLSRLRIKGKKIFQSFSKLKSLILSSKFTWPKSEKYFRKSKNPYLEQILNIFDVGSRLDVKLYCLPLNKN